ncbi:MULTISPECIES: trypco2 family protein [unclassified Geodermatophilus]|uniref:trypco2 family protein n=1 Tax=unclassified Geodermatophilus TaxID=2637632 RepID=UPI003EEB9A6C
MDEDIELSEYIEALRSELRAAELAGKNRTPRFAVGPVELELEVAGTREAGAKGDIKFWVVSLGGSAKASVQRTQRLKVTLTPLDDHGQPLVVNARPDARPD